LTNATAIGANASVSHNNALVLGNNANVGIGTTAPGSKLEVIDASNTGLHVQNNTAGGRVASFGGNGAFQIDAPFNPGGRLTVLENGNVGIGATSPTNKLQIVDSANTGLRVQTDMAGGTVASFGSHGAFQVDAVGTPGGRFYVTEDGKVGIGLDFNGSPDKLAVNGTVSLLLASGGSTQICKNNGNQLSTCSSSLRYKTNIATWPTGLSLISRLRPVTFDWKQNGEHDLGLVAEEVANVEPLLVTHNAKGEIEGVKYDRVAVVLLNAVKEQQHLIEQQQHQIEALKNLVCSSHRKALVCK